MGTVQTVVSMVLSFLSIKVTSVYLGPEGLGTLGQLSYFIAMSQAVLAAGFGTSLVRRTAELGDDHAARERVVSTVLRTLLAVGIPVSLAIGLASRWLARELLHDGDLWVAVAVFGAVFVFGLLGTVIMSCANGAKDFRTMALINIGGAVASFLMILALCPHYGVMGGLIATASLPLMRWAISWGLARRHAWWPRHAFWHGFSVQEARSATAFVPLAVISAVGMPLLQLLIRDNLISHSGMASVGLLQGVMRISEMYVGTVTWLIAMYFFPRFSEIREAGELLREIKKGLIVIVPAGAVISVALYLLRDWVVRVVFTSAFLPMRDLFAWQMVGNTFQMVGWLFGCVLLAKANALKLAVLEITTIATWWLLSLFLIGLNGAVGATQAYASTYALYALATAIGVVLLINKMR